MSRILPAQPSPDPLRLPEKVGTAPLKAALPSESIGIGDVAFDALVAHYGSVKALAFALGECDPSQARAEIKAADFRRFNRHAQPEAKSALADALVRTFRQLTSPQQMARQSLRLIRFHCDQIEQFLEFTA